MQIVHKLKKPAKEYTEDFPKYHKDYSRLVISVMYTVIDSVSNPNLKSANGFFANIAASAK